MKGAICVTGATGYLGGHLTRILLQHGYKVHATTRKETREKYPDKIKALLALPGAKDNLKLFDADLLNEASFAPAVKNCDCVMHTASPFFFAGSYSELVGTADEGTRAVMRAAKANNCNKLVLTSSMASVYNCPRIADLSAMVTDEDWSNEEGLKQTKQIYALSKYTAERTAWQLSQELEMKMSVINPVLLWGPIQGKSEIMGAQGEQKANINSSLGVLLAYCDGSRQVIQNCRRSVADVRDVALAHVLAFEKELWGQRHPMSGGCPMMEEVAAECRAELLAMGLDKWAARVPTKVALEPETSTLGAPHPQPTLVDPAIAQRLGLQYTPWQQTLKDTLHSLHKFHYLT